MIRAENIRALSDFQRNTKKHLRRLKASGEPEVLTVNGKAAVVIQSAEGYDLALAAASEQAELDRLRLAIQQADNDEGVSVDEVFAEIDHELRKRGLR